MASQSSLFSTHALEFQALFQEIQEAICGPSKSKRSSDACGPPSPPTPSPEFESLREAFQAVTDLAKSNQSSDGPSRKKKRAKKRRRGEFERFQRLPKELRDMIWESACMEPRIVFVEPRCENFNVNAEIYGTKYIKCRAAIRTPPPAILAVNFESRQMGLKFYKEICVMQYAREIYFNFDFDTLYFKLIDRYKSAWEVEQNLEEIMSSVSVQQGIQRLAFELEDRRSHNTTMQFCTLVAKAANLQEVICYKPRKVNPEKCSLPCQRDFKEYENQVRGYAQAIDLFLAALARQVLQNGQPRGKSYAHAAPVRLSDLPDLARGYLIGTNAKSTIEVGATEESEGGLEEGSSGGLVEPDAKPSTTKKAKRRRKKRGRKKGSRQNLLTTDVQSNTHVSVTEVGGGVKKLNCRCMVEHDANSTTHVAVTGTAEVVPKERKVKEKEETEEEYEKWEEAEIDAELKRLEIESMSENFRQASL